MSRLNFGQANAVSSSLAGIDEFITEVRAVLNAKNGTHFLQYENIPDLPERQAIMHSLNTLVAELHRTQRTLDLDVPLVDVRKKVRHQAALLVAELADRKSSALRRYGWVDPVVAPELDAAVERITASLHQLSGE
jgi:hypothetical protein